MSVIETASRVLRDEADAVISLVDKLDGQFEGQSISLKMPKAGWC